ncbi:MAG: topoisomerase C-terminal repeat-containing protein, partial [Acidimicrobiales bacterium]
VEGEDDPETELADREIVLPPLAEGDQIGAQGFEPGAHSTQPPARYTEASLVKAMEELGVGRPATYVSVIGTILDRGYVWKKGSALVPSFTAFAVVGLLERYFGDLVDYNFTAAMEDDLDEIASGRQEPLPWLTRFYFGPEHEVPGGDDATGRIAGVGGAHGDAAPDGGGGPGGGVTGRLGLKMAVATHLGDIDAREVNSIPIGTDDGGRTIVVRVGRYGPYLQRDEDRAAIPDDLAPDELTMDRASELLAAPSGDRDLGADPETGLTVRLRAGRYGPYVQLGDVAEGGHKPRTTSLFASMSPDALTLAEALELLRIPRSLGVDPETGEEVVAHNGKFGPYLKRGSDTRSLSSEDQLLRITLDEAQAVFRQPKTRRGRSAAPLRELGVDPGNGLAVVLREGRFGPYVTDGTTNASLRRGDDPATVTIDRAVELLAERRAAGPPARRQRAAGTKKAPAKKSAAKKSAAKKSAAKKAPGSGASKKSE